MLIKMCIYLRSIQVGYNKINLVFCTSNWTNSFGNHLYFKIKYFNKSLHPLKYNLKTNRCTPCIDILIFVSISCTPRMVTKKIQCIDSIVLF